MPDENLDDAPPQRRCGTMPVHHLLLESDPDFRQRLADLEVATAQRQTSADAAFRAAGPITIPIVVHVVHKTAAQNISDAQIHSQLVVLNQDFRARNPDRTSTPSVWSGLVTDAQVEFVLATEDPDGNPTNGITRTATTKDFFFAEDDDVKFVATGGQDAWPTDRYLNIWVCHIRSRRDNQTLLGYAQFPTGRPETDGVVILHRAFGTTGSAAAPFNLGRTATHEVGHWLNLYHIWGGGDLPSCNDTDSVEDTPNQFGPNFNKPTFPHISCNNGPNGDMFMNYMDYVDDDSMFMFTAQQVARMQAALDGPRRTIGRP